MSRILIVAIALALAAGLPAAAQSPTALTAPDAARPSDAAQALHQLFDAEWERGLVESPESASASGDPRFNDRWSDESLDAIHHHEAEDRAALDRLHTIDRTALSPADQLDYDTFEWELRHAVARQKFQEYLRPISSGDGVQTADGLAEVLPFATTKDYRDWLARMDAIPVLVDQSIALMKAGVAAGNMPPKVLLQRSKSEIAAQIVDDPSKSPFYRPFLKFADTVPAADRPQLQADAQRLVRERIVPAYRKLATYFNDDYLPKARDSIAAADLPDGKAYYDFLAGYYTTTDLTAEQIHAIGLREVARIHAEMEKVKDQTGFKGTLSEFFTYLRSDPRFFEKTPEALLERYRATAKRIDPELVKIVRTLPRLPYGVRPIPDNVAPDSTTAYYQQGANDG
ncbi:MAG TPA: DUF885 domain-containing protein, partial [Xanthomonadaceae bacterium]|nr:DUF885 domain-containing protein [Xanthomonadaceae bacterium]